MLVSTVCASRVSLFGLAINFEYSPLPGVRASHKRVLRSTLSVYVGAVCGAPEAKLEHPSLSVGRGALRAGAGRPHGHGQPPTTPRIPRRARNPRVRRITASLHAPHSVPWSHTRHPEPRHDEHECEVHAGRCSGHCTVSGDYPRSWGRRIAHLRQLQSFRTCFFTPWKVAVLSALPLSTLPPSVPPPT